MTTSVARPRIRHAGVAFVVRAEHAAGHDALTKASHAASLARLLDTEFTGTFDAGGRRPAGRPYFVPCSTLQSGEAAALGIGHWSDLFGGIAPQPFIATKVITHPLPSASSTAPEGWSPSFAERIKRAVLEGYSVFSADDARVACRRLLAGGAVRLKPADGVGGAGQHLVTQPEQLEALLDSQQARATLANGWVLERNLDAACTCSIGQVRVGEWTVTYHGQQWPTRNHHGETVYGGSSLHVVRGGFGALLQLELGDEMRMAIEQTLHYHRAALESFNGLTTSRSNYDVVQGTDANGRWHSGVLEQSWRIGGASGAELAALHAMKQDPALKWVRASTHEIYAGPTDVPPNATVHFDGTDAGGGRLLKFTTLDAYGDA